jgi:hypothetical protein
MRYQVMAAGLALALAAAAPAPALAQTAEEWLAAVSEDCGQADRFGLDDYALHRAQHETQQSADAERAKYITERAYYRGLCIQNHYDDLPTDAQALIKPHTDKMAADAVAFLTALNAKAKAAFEANPAPHTWIGRSKASDEYSPQSLRKILDGYKKFKTLAQTCGTFDYSLPYMDNNYINRRRAERLAYANCVVAYRDRDDPISLGDITFGIATTEVLAYAPFVCSKRPGPGCIKDKDWNAVYAVANPENRAFVKRTDELRSKEKYSATSDAIQRTNDWAEQVEQSIQAYNASQ